MPELIRINIDKPERDIVSTAAESLKKGELVIYPTETLYGLAADCSSEKALQRLFDVKKRDRTKPVPLIASTMEMINEYTINVSGTAKRLAEEFWPGPLTLIFRASENVSRIVTGNTHTVGFRVPSCRLCLDLVETFGRPITATSANISGEEGCSRIEDINGELKNYISLILDGGETNEIVPSTVLAVYSDIPVMVRQGVINIDRIEEFLGFRIVKSNTV